MSLPSACWNRILTVDEKSRLLQIAYPERSEELIYYEAEKKWQDLLPSTTAALLSIDWERCIGKDVQP